MGFWGVSLAGLSPNALCVSAMLVCPWQALQEQIKEKVPFQIQEQEAIQKSQEKEIPFQREEQEVSEHIQNQVMTPVLSRAGIVPWGATPVPPPLPPLPCAAD